MSKQVKLIKALSWLSIIVFMLMPAFRLTLYQSMPVVSGEPSGLSDIIELLLGYLFLCVIILSCTMAIVLFINNQGGARRAIGYLLGFSILLFFLFIPAHELACRLAV